MTDRDAPNPEPPLRRPSSRPAVEELEDTQALLPETLPGVLPSEPRPAPLPPRPRPPRPAAPQVARAGARVAAPSQAHRRVSPWLLAGLAVGALAAAGIWVAVVSGSARRDATALGGSSPGLAGQPAAEELPRLSDFGNTIELRADGSVVGLEAVGPNVRRAVAEALRTGTLPDQPELASLRSPQRTPAPPPTAGTPATSTPIEAPRLIAPVGVRLLGDRPRFTWSEVAGATGYEVAVLDRHGTALVASPHLRSPSWETPRPLPRGRPLIWRLTTRVRRGDVEPPISEARFALVPEEEMAWLEREIAAGRESRLVKAVLYAEVGALDDCQAPLVELARDNPRAAVIGRLLADLLRKKGD